jgi:hypothetical protein
MSQMALGDSYLHDTPRRGVGCGRLLVSGGSDRVFDGVRR